MLVTRFDLSHPPFDLLTQTETATLSASADVLFFTNDQEILPIGSAVDSLYLVIKGLVREMAGEDVVGVHREHETFDCRALVTGKATHRFVAHEEVLLCVFPRQEVLTLTERNPAFGAHFFATVSDKFGQLAQARGHREWQSLFTTKISDAGFQPAVFIDATASVADAALLMKEQHCRSIFVRDENRDGEKIGIFTASHFRDVVAGGISYQTPLKEHAQFSLLSCEKNESLFNALLLMTRRNISRVVVVEDGVPVGVLAQADLLSFFSNHSLSIAQQIETAATFDDLALAVQGMHTLVEGLATQGMKMSQLARLVQALNSQMMARLWQIVAPPDIFDCSSLLALGSEGRGEQILKTDQDNALILAEGLDEDAVQQAADAFTECMVRLGYPLCVGGIMVNQKLWRHTVRDWIRVLQEWAMQSHGDPLMNIAIFLDAETVTGSTAWLEVCRNALVAGVRDDAAWFSRMALPVEQFQNVRAEGGFWWQLLNREENARLDIKKAGIFPIVHGIRVLALDSGVKAINTFDRLEALASKGVLEKAMVDDLVESLTFLMRLRLDVGLELLRTGKPINNEVDTASLSTLDKDLLKDSLLVVKRFKQMINQRYHLDRF
jgi:CBS domain-containing protein